MKIAVLAGDGIGPEIVGQALKVLRRLAADGIAAICITPSIARRWRAFRRSIAQPVPAI